MQEQLVTFKTAKLAKEKGFNEPVLYHYLDDEEEGNFILTPNESHFSTEVKMVRGVIDIGETNNVTTTENLYDVFNEEIEYYISAPTQSLLQKWLREVHNIYVNSKPYIDDVSNETDENIKFQILWENEIIDVKDSYNVFSDYTYYHNYEEALEIGLQEGLKLIK